MKVKSVSINSTMGAWEDAEENRMVNVAMKVSNEEWKMSNAV
jgi:hypothetical protein